MVDQNITLFIFIKMFCGTDGTIQNILLLCLNMWNICIILSVPCNIVMDMNNIKK